MIVPTLTTDRLVLLPPDPDRDLADMTAMYADAAVYGRVGSDAPLPREEVWRRLLAQVGQWQVFGFGNWTLRDRNRGRFVGTVGVFAQRRAIGPCYEGVPEAGWGLVAAWHGQGYAAEALAALFAWVDARSIERTICFIAPDNGPSLRLAARFGFTPPAARHGAATADVYERSRRSTA